MSPTPAGVEPPTPENVEVYRAAVLAYRRSYREECRKWGPKLMDPHIPKRTAAEAIVRLRPSFTYDEAYNLAHRACAWAAQAHREWFWREVD